VPDLFARIAPILRSAVTRGPKDPRITGLRRGARIAVTGWVLCVIPLLTISLGYLLLYLPQINRALWQSESQQAHLLAAAAAGRRYTMAAVDTVSIALLTLSLAGSIYIIIGLARRLTTVGLRWSAGRPARRLLAAVAAVASLTALAAFWTIQGQFLGW
jgi:putative peptide zinc metalloprotease protein